MCQNSKLVGKFLNFLTITGYFQTNLSAKVNFFRIYLVNRTSNLQARFFMRLIFHRWKRILLLIVAVTVHNIPEGLAVGVAFGSIGKAPSATFESARNLAIGIGIQVKEHFSSFHDDI